MTVLYLPKNLPLTRMIFLGPSCTVRTICGQLVTLCLHLGDFPPPPPPPPPPTHPPPCDAGLKLMHTLQRSKIKQGFYAIDY